ncbi:uncharacterized protein CELE_C53C11.2 [Caenorhabditis elegans]|uniref:Uncharacterized protein n=1 Tax=Caenorhabditis elegans TaxID=6239 RepID=P91185_CAEEL|nr:Uncharacterized protein CELE_C53C11.2 [Caenorhabditis elegans]CCD67926.1 Uncharacterized protein CELE_C53C11.2 [Caenorhabditis elegans]|eukprot:NP_510811.1 Uncharacterized protein CELE_C53C11.2 [Caenorhabditis elegans]
MLLDEMLLPKTTQQNESCDDPMVQFMGINMGICLILTAIVAIAAILGCILLLLCVKFVTDRDERKTQAARNKISANEEKTESGSVTSGTNTTALITDERAALTTIVVVDENDM